MGISAEARLWWQAPAGGYALRWFEALGKLPGGCDLPTDANWPEERTDIYLFEPGQTELGVKLRAAEGKHAKLEVKTLVDTRDDLAPLGPVTLWTKVASTELTLDGRRVATVRKWRRLRKYGWSGGGLIEVALDHKEKTLSGERPAAGCHVECTRVERNGSPDTWWTLGFEAFGSLGEVETILNACVAHAHGKNPLPEGGVPASYPEWLATADNQGG